MIAVQSNISNRKKSAGNENMPKKRRQISLISFVRWSARSFNCSPFGENKNDSLRLHKVVANTYTNRELQRISCTIFSVSSFVHASSRMPSGRLCFIIDIMHHLHFFSVVFSLSIRREPRQESYMLCSVPTQRLLLLSRLSLMRHIDGIQ